MTTRGVAQRVRIVFAIPSLDRGGPDRVLFELLCGLDRSRFAPRLLVSASTGDYLARLPSDVPIDVLGERGVMRGRYPVARTLQYLRRLRPDVVFGTQRMILTLGAIAHLLPSSTRLVFRQANDVTADSAALMQTAPVKQRIARQLLLSSLRRAHAVVCQSHAMKADLTRLLGRADPLRVIHNPIDLETIDRASHIGAPRVPGSPALVSVGRLVPQKGYDLLLRAIAQLRARHPDLHLTIFGEGPDRTHLERMRSELGLTATVTFAGFSTEHLAAIRSADLFVLASRYEGFPNAALEALACGTPVVLTDCPGANAEIVRTSKNGRLASGIDPEAFAVAVGAALLELRGYSRTEIRRDCETRFSTAKIVRSYEEVFLP